MPGIFLYVGLAFVAIGIVIIVAAAFLGKQGDTKTEMGIGGFMGPIPFGFATNRGMLYLVLTALSLSALIFVLIGR